MKKTSFRLLLITVLCLSLISGLWIAAPPSIEARGSSWSVQVFSDPNLTTLIWSGLSPTVSYTWGSGPPVINGAATGAPADNFSVRFTTTAFFTAGNYRFTVQVDDGARLYVDGLLLINQWTTGTFRTFQADMNFASDGNHTIVVEMFDATVDASIIANWALAVGPSLMCTEGNQYPSCPKGWSPGGAPAPLGWPPSSGPHAICNDGWNSCSIEASGTCSSHSGVREWCLDSALICSGTTWYGEFFNGIDLAGGAIYTTTLGPSGLSQNWAQGTPGGPVPVDNWSARFTRTVTVPTDLPQGIYKFYAKADDNFRFTVDATVIFDKWDSWGGDMQTADVTLLNGSHTFKYEYRERTVDAFIFLTWTPGSAQCPVIAPDGSGGSGGGTGSGTGQPTGVTGTVNASVLNFRSGPSTSAPILAKLNKGATYPVTGRSADNIWAQIVVNGTTGWVMAQYLTFAGDFNSVPVVGGGAAPAPQVPQPTGAKGITQGNLRIRAAPTRYSAQIGLIPWGTTVDIYGKDEGHTWYQVNYNGTIGWAFAPWIKLTVGNFDLLPYTDGTQPANIPAAPTEGVIVQAQGNVRIRSGPGLWYPKIARAVWGTRLQVIGRSTNLLWYKVRYGDLTGWTYGSWYRLVQGDLGSLPVGDQ